MEIELRQLFAYARRFWWILLLGPIIGGMTSYEVSSRSPSVYSTSALLQVNPPQNDSTFSPDSIESSQALATSFVRLVDTPPVLQPVVDQFTLAYGVDGFRDHVNAWTIPGTHYIEISVTDGNANRVADLANAVAASLARQVADQAVELGNPVRDTITSQVQSLDEQIAQIQSQIANLQPATGAPTASAQTQIDTLQTTLTQLQQSKSTLLLNQQSLDLGAVSAQSLITITSPAEVATSPIEPKPRVAALLGGTFGLFLAASLAIGIAYLDNTVKPYTDYPAIIGAPLLTRIGRHPKLRTGPGQLFLLQHPNDPASEAIRILRTNLEFATSTRKFVSLAIASPGACEGKSTVIANLAIATAKAGMRTVLIDADLRRPTQHQIFNASNYQGLSTYLKGSTQFWEDLAIQTSLPNLVLMPSGPIPPNAADLLSVGRMQEMLRAMEDYADIILIDTPPVLQFSDALIIAAEVDAVMVVCKSEHTRLDALRRTVGALEPSNSRLVGVVLNQQTTRDKNYVSSAYYKPAARPLGSQN